MQQKLTLLKLGGSLITDKSRARTPRLEALSRMAEEVKTYRRNDPFQQLIVGNGAGSYGHIPAKLHGTRAGVKTPEEWLGFVEVGREAEALNHLVIKAFQAVELPAIAIHPCSVVIARDGKVESWDLNPLRSALHARLIPVIHGDVIFDIVRGGTILSTEDLFTHLVKELRPERMLLAGIEEGVWADFPACTQLIKEISPEKWGTISNKVAGSVVDDVTGGMRSKVEQCLELITQYPEMEILIFSGMHPDAIRAALSGASIGTRIHSDGCI